MPVSAVARKGHIALLNGPFDFGSSSAAPCQGQVKLRAVLRQKLDVTITPVPLPQCVLYEIRSCLARVFDCGAVEPYSSDMGNALFAW